MSRMAFFLVIFGGFLVPVSPNISAALPVFELSGTPAEREALFSKILIPGFPLKGPQNVQLLEERTGDDLFGPADVRTFGTGDLLSEDMAQWMGHLVPRRGKPSYVAPEIPRAWWPGRDRFDALAFYNLPPSNGRIGWVGLSLRTGRAVFFTATQ